MVHAQPGNVTQVPHALTSGFADLRIGQLLEKRASISPNWPCWRTLSSVYNYGQLHTLARQVAAALLASKLSPNASVGVVAYAGFERWAFQYGAALAGMVAAHASPQLTQPEMTHFCQHSGVQLLLVNAQQLSLVQACLPEWVEIQRVVVLPASFLDAARDANKNLENSSLPTLPERCVGWEKWLALGDETQTQSCIPLAESLDPAAPFQMLYTSGATGTPKGVRISHRAKIAQGLVHSVNLGLQPGDTLLSALPAHHQFAQWLIGVSVPLSGACVFACPQFSAQQFWHLLTTQAIRCLPAVPTMLYRLLQTKPSIVRTQLRSIVYGAASIQTQCIQKLRQCFGGVKLFQGFGQTEAGYCLGLHDHEHDLRPDSIGRPDLFSQVKLVSPEGERVALGEVGELVVRTPYMMNGYHKDDAATAAYFSYGQGWGRTGDLARCDSQGFYTLAGRAIECIMSGGVKVYPLEVEKALAQMKGVEEVAVLGLPDADWGEVVVCVWQGKAGDNMPNSDALRRYCRQVLSPEKRPKRFVRLEALPRTSSGKIHKASIKQRLL